MLTANDHQGKLGGDRNVLTLDSGDGWTTVYICKNKDNREVVSLSGELSESVAVD